MSRTGVDTLDRSIEKTNAWLADVAASFGTQDRKMAFRVTRAWLHTLRDRLPVQVAAHLAAQLPELLRGVFYEGWNPSKVPVKYDGDEFTARFARDAQVHLTEVAKSARLVTTAMRQHLSAGAINEAFAVLPSGIARMLGAVRGEAAAAEEAAPAARKTAARATTARKTAARAGTSRAGSSRAGTSARTRPARPATGGAR